MSDASLLAAVVAFLFVVASVCFAFTEYRPISRLDDELDHMHKAGDR